MASNHEKQVRWKSIQLWVLSLSWDHSGSPSSCLVLSSHTHSKHKITCIMHCIDVSIPDFTQLHYSLRKSWDANFSCYQFCLLAFHDRYYLHTIQHGHHLYSLVYFLFLQDLSNHITPDTFLLLLFYPLCTIFLSSTTIFKFWILLYFITKTMLKLFMKPWGQKYVTDSYDQ